MPIKYTLETKKDLWNIPDETRVLRIKCKLSQHAASKIIEQCREIEKIIFEGHAYALTEKSVIEYLEPLVFVIIKGEVKGHGLDEKTADKIRELYATGGHTLESLAIDFNTTKEVIWHVVNDKAPTHLERE